MKRFLGTLALALWCALFYQVALKPPQPVPYTAEEREAWRPRFVAPGFVAPVVTNTTKHNRAYAKRIAACWTSQ